MSQLCKQNEIWGKLYFSASIWRKKLLKVSNIVCNGNHGALISTCEYWFRPLKSGDLDTEDKECEGRTVKCLTMLNWVTFLTSSVLLTPGAWVALKVLKQMLIPKGKTNKQNKFHHISKQWECDPKASKLGTIQIKAKRRGKILHLWTAGLRTTMEGFLHQIVLGDEK